MPPPSLLMLVSRMTPATGTVSRMKSNGSFLYSDVLMALLGASNRMAGTAAVLDHELLAEVGGEPVRHDTGGDVDRASGRKAGDQTNRPARIFVGAGGGRNRRPGEAENQKCHPGSAHATILPSTSFCSGRLAAA